MKLLMVPLVVLLVAPLLGGCVMEDRYPHGYYRPAYVRYHHYPMRHGGWRVGSADDGAQPATEVAEGAPAAQTE